MVLSVILKLLFENIAIISIILIIAGAVKLFSYYKLFGVSIFGFIELKEILILFFANLLSFFSILFFLVVVIVLYNYLSIITLVFIPVIFFVFTCVYYKMRRFIFLYEVFLQNFMFISLFVILILGLRYIPEDMQKTDEFGKIILALFFIYLIIFALVNSYNEFYKVKNKKYFSRTRIWIQNEEIETNENKYFIGKTSNFIFIHDQLKETTEVYPMSSVNKIMFVKQK